MAHLTLVGAHRGGGAFTEQILQSESTGLDAVTIIDPNESYCSTLRKRWTGAGYRTRSDTQALTRVSRLESSVLVLCTDDIGLQLALFDNNVSRTVVMGIIIASRDYDHRGGVLLGLGVVAPERDTRTRSEAGALFSRLVNLTQEGRRASANLTDPVLNTAQVEAVRTSLYRGLATETRRVLTSPEINGSVLISTWHSPAPSTVRIRDWESRTRMEMWLEAERETNAPAVCWLDQSRLDWLYVTIPSADLSVELPVSPAVSYVAEQREIEARRLYATD